MLYKHKGYTLIHPKYQKYQKNYIITDNCGSAWICAYPIGDEMTEDEAEKYIDSFLSMQDLGITFPYKKLKCVLNADDKYVYRMPGNSSCLIEIKKS